MISDDMVTTYKQFRCGRPMTPRERVRHVILELATTFGKPRKSSQASVVFMAFHYLFEDNINEFHELLQLLSSEFNFITVTAAVNGLKEGSIKGNNLCFTCDDGFMSNVKAGQILKEYGASCCYFLCPDFIGLSDTASVTKVNREKLGGPPIQFMSWNDVDVLLLNGHEIGNHTHSHMMLSKLDDEMLEKEIGRAHEILTEHCGNIHHFAAPYGHPLSFDDRAVDKIRGAGYISFFTTIRGEHFVASSCRDIVFKRQHFEPFWPTRHSRYFVHRKSE